MAYVRQRTSKAGTPSTALVEAYRDAQGRPRQRLLANLHGETTLLKALAKLTVLRDVLREEMESLLAEVEQVNDDEAATVAERDKVDRLRRRLWKRFVRIEKLLATIGKDRAAIEQHCTATPDEIQDAIRAHKQEFMDAFHKAVVLGYALAQQRRAAKAALRRLST